jgi:hypothetical protein
MGLFSVADRLSIAQELTGSYCLPAWNALPSSGFIRFVTTPFEAVIIYVVITLHVFLTADCIRITTN